MRQHRLKTHQLFSESFHSFLKDDGPTWSASIAYYSLLSLFPLLLVTASLAAYFVAPEEAVAKIISVLGDFLPKGKTEVEEILMKTHEASKSTGIFFMAFLFWIGTLAFSAITKALNIISKTQERYSLWKKTLIRFGILVPLGVLFIMALSSEIIFRYVKSLDHALPPGSDVVINIFISLIPAVLIQVAFFLAYRFIPRKRPRAVSALVGATVAAVLFVAAKWAFFAYVEYIARDNLIYGSLAGIIAVVGWFWIMAMIGLYGAQFSFLYDAQRKG